jgi:hypothetical protein
LLDVFRLLKGYQLQGHEVIAKWFIIKEEDFMAEEVEDFITNSGLAIEVIFFGSYLIVD